MKKSYLSTPEIMSQAWLHPVVLVSVLSVVKLWIFTRSINSTVNGLKIFANSACQNANTFWNDSVLLQAQMDSLVSALVAALMEYAIGLIKIFCSITITVAAALVSFSVEMYLGTITCLCVALVQGTIECVVDALRLITAALQSAVNAALKDFNNTLRGLSSVINTAILGIDALKSLFGQASLPASTLTDAAQKVNLTLSSLANVSIPTAYINKIEKFSNEIPSFENVLSNVTSLMTLPLHRLAVELQNVPGKSTESLNSSTINYDALPWDAYLPFCLTLGLAFDRALALANSVLKMILITLSVVTGLLSVGFIVLAYIKNRKRSELLQKLAQESHPERVGNKLQQFDLGIWAWLQRPLRIDQQWYFSFCCTRNILNCFAIGAIGFLTVGLQYLILGAVKKELSQIQNGPESPDLVNVQRHLSKALVNDLQNSVNALVAGINNILFSSVRTASSDLLKNMVMFQNQANTTISSVFDKTPFANPARTIVYCTIGRKIDDIEDGLKWIIVNLNIPTPNISMTLLNATVAMNSSAYSTVLPEIPLVSQSIWESYQQAEEHFTRGLITELIICSVFSGIWVFYIVIGAIIVWYRAHQAEADVPCDQMISWPKRIEKSNRPKEYPHLDPLPHDSWSIFGD